MTVATDLNRKTYTGNGVTASFDTNPMIFFDEGDLDVYVVTTATGAVLKTLVLNTDYSVTGGAGTTGTISTAGGSVPYGAPAAGTTLVVVRTLDILQASDLVNNDASDAEVVEDGLDRLTLIAQQLSARQVRSFTLADSDVSGASTVVPTPSANKLIGWNAAGTALESKIAADIDLSIVSAFVQTILDDVDAAAVRTTITAAKSGANTDITSVYLSNTGLKIKDTDASHGLSIVPGSNITADRTFTLTTGDASRTLTMGGDISATAAVSITGAFTTAAAFTTAGANALTLTTTGPTSVTLPTSGTLARVTSETFVTPTLGVAAATSINFGQTALSYYGEGTWTPNPSNLTTSGTPTYTGTYTRTGNRCQAYLKVASTVTTTSTAGTTFFDGLPFTVGENGVAPACSEAAVSQGNGMALQSVNRIYPPTWSANASISLSFNYKV